MQLPTQKHGPVETQTLLDASVLYFILVSIRSTDKPFLSTRPTPDAPPWLCVFLLAFGCHFFSISWWTGAE